MEDRSKENLMLKNAFILSFAAILSKVLGAVYQIFLFGTIGEAAGTYTQGIYIYAMLLAISASGIPIAISKLMSEEIAKGNTGIAHKIFRVAFVIVAVVGLVLSVGLFFAAPFINQYLYPEYNLTFVIQALAPALLVVTIMASYRGYFQGQQNMGPTAYSQIFEQLGRIVFSVVITIVIIYTVAQTNLGNILGPIKEMLPTDISNMIVDAIAFGPFIGALLGFIPILYFYRKRNKVFNKTITYTSRRSRSEARTGYIAKRIIMFAVPVTIAALLPTLIDLADGILIPQVLMDAGVDKIAAKSYFSYFANTAMVLINIITLVASSFAISLVPAISDAKGRKNDEEVKRKTALSIKLVTLISLPAAASMFLLNQPIIGLLFSRANDYSYILQASVFMILFMAIYHSTTGVLQGVGKIYIPLISLFVGLVVNVIALKIFLPIEGLHILGAPIAHTMAYLAAAAINFIAVKKVVGYRSRWLTWLPQTLLSALVTGGVAYGVYQLLSFLIGFLTQGFLNTLISLIVAVIAGVGVYLITLVLFKAIKEDEVSSIPKIGFVFRKLFKKMGRS